MSHPKKIGLPFQIGVDLVFQFGIKCLTGLQEQGFPLPVDIRGDNFGQNQRVSPQFVSIEFHVSHLSSALACFTDKIRLFPLATILDDVSKLENTMRFHPRYPHRPI
jgi:hypothetical protein